MAPPAPHLPLQVPVQLPPVPEPPQLLVPAPVPVRELQHGYE